MQRVTSQENHLREKIASGSLNPDDYTALATLLYDTNRFDESQSTLRNALGLPFPDLARAVLLTSLGWRVREITGDTAEPLLLGEQAMALTQTGETTEALIARAGAQHLFADCAWNVDSTLAIQAATDALSLFERVIGASEALPDRKLYEIYFEASRLNKLLGRGKEALEQCERALRYAQDETERVFCKIGQGTILRHDGRLEEAREIFMSATKSSGLPVHLLVHTYYELGLAERALGKLPEARAKHQSALRILQDDPALPRCYMQESELLHSVAEISYELGDFDTAAKEYRVLVESYPSTDPLHWYCLVWVTQCQLDMRQFEAARSNAERIAASSVASEDQRECASVSLRMARYSIIKSLYDSGDYVSCIAEGESLLPLFERANDGYLPILLLLGHSYLALKNPEARKYYEAIVAHPDASATDLEIAKTGLARLAALRK